MGPYATVRPEYGTGSLAEVLDGVLAAIGAGPSVVGPARDADPLGLVASLQDVRRVAVLVADGLGYALLPRTGRAVRAAPVLADAAAGRIGQLRRITAPFPSTTPVSLATLATGAPPGAHGVLGFTTRVPGTDQVLNHVDWAGDPDPERWQPVPTRFARAAAAGVAVRVVNRSEFVGSGLSAAVYRGAPYLPADDGAALVAQMRSALADPDPPVLVFGYHAEPDRAGHRYGVRSRRWRAALSGLDRIVARLVDGLPPDAALVVTADHGQLDVPKRHRFDLDRDPRLRDGVAVVAGEPRVRYLHTVPGAAADVVASWRGVLGDAARVMLREEAVAEGWYGPVPAEHADRLGDVVVVCEGTHAVLATAHESPRTARLVALHGSWTAPEMRVPLLVLRDR